MGSNNNKRPGTMLPNQRPGMPQSPQFGGNPVGRNGQPSVPTWWNGQNGGNTGRPGNQMGGGSPSSIASTEGFNQFLQQFMQGGGFQQMMGGMQGGPQWNPYMSLINPRGGSYRPSQVGNPAGTPPSPWGNPNTPPTFPNSPQLPTGPNGNPIPYPGTVPPDTSGRGQAPPGFAMPGGINSYKPRMSMQEAPQFGAGGNQPSQEMLQQMLSSAGGGQPDGNTMSIQAPGWGNAIPNSPPPNPEQGWEGVMPGSPITLPPPPPETGWAPNGMRPPTGGPNYDPQITPPNPLTQTGGFVNEYGMPTGGFGGLQNVSGQYNSTQYNPFSGQQPGMLDAQNGMFNDPAFLQQLQMGLGGSAQLGDAGSADVYGKFATDTQNLLGRKADRDTADLRARYGMSGGSSLGSAAALAEGNFRAENSAQVGRALGEINLQERGLNLQSRGQDLQNYLGSRGLDVNQLGMMAQNNQFGGDLNLRAGMSNQNAQQNWQQLMSQNNQFGNLFGQAENQFGANFGQNAQIQNNQFGLQNQQQTNQYGLGVAGIGVQQQQMQQQQQTDYFRTMMQAYQNQAGWNTPQAENVVNPSRFSQGMDIANFLGNIYGGYQNRNR